MSKLNSRIRSSFGICQWAYFPFHRGSTAILPSYFYLRRLLCSIQKNTFQSWAMRNKKKTICSTSMIFKSRFRSSIRVQSHLARPWLLFSNKNLYRSRNLKRRPRKESTMKQTFDITGSVMSCHRTLSKCFGFGTKNYHTSNIQLPIENPLQKGNTEACYLNR